MNGTEYIVRYEEHEDGLIIILLLFEMGFNTYCARPRSRYSTDRLINYIFMWVKERY